METLVVQSDQDDVELYHRIRHLVQTHLQEDEEQYELVCGAIRESRRRVVLSVSFLNKINPAFAKRMLQDPFSCFPATETALADVARSIATLAGSTSKAYNSVKEREQLFDLRLGLTGWLGSHSVTPRGLTARLANKLICVQGIVTKCSLINPKLTFGTYYIPELDRHFFREQIDNVTIKPRSKLATTNSRVIASSVDDEGRKIEMEFGLSVYKDSQRLTVQEMPEMTPSGQLPRTVDVICEYDLVDRVNPGDRARFWGVMRAIPTSNSNLSSGFANCFLVANNIEHLNTEKRCPVVTPVNLKEFRDISMRDDLLDIIAASVAPSISGHDIVKRGLALQVIGGDRKIIHGDGSRLRGDIHILLIGDPSCGKSQMLRFMMNLAPMALSTTGRGSSAVGLTAAVVVDSDTGERRLEAGAMVLADGGLVCIDEFDKMGFDDRVAVHEVMEQQRVTINKAGISATLNARTSVLAAANPVYGLFDDSVEFSKQINFPDSLLSRFDLIFIIRESSTPQQDRKISSQVLSQLRTPHEDSLHQIAGIIPGQRSTTIQPDAIVLADKQPTRGNSKASSSVWTKQGKILSVTFLRKYLQYCRSQPAPILTDEAVEMTAEFYANLRHRLNSGTAIGTKAIPTPRLLEACIRLATAHAKLKLKKVVDVTDVAEAKKLILFTMCGDQPEATVEPAKQQRKRRLDDEIIVEIATKTLTIDPMKNRKRVRFSTDVPTQCDAERIAVLSTVIDDIRDKLDVQEFDLEELIKNVNKAMLKRGNSVFDEGEIMAGFKKLQEQNQLM